MIKIHMESKFINFFLEVLEENLWHFLESLDFVCLSYFLIGIFKEILTSLTWNGSISLIRFGKAASTIFLSWMNSEGIATHKFTEKTTRNSGKSCNNTSMILSVAI